MNKVILSFLVIAAAMVSFASSAFAAYGDPPTRAGRLSYIKGDVSLQPGDTDDWTWASMNRPVTTGDNIWVSRRGRAEIRVGSMAIRADQKTSLSILNLDDSGVQLGLNSGVMIVHLRSLPQDGYFEIDTPNVAVTLLRAGDYRIETDESGDFTRVAVRTGKAEVTGSRDSFRIAQGSEAEITGSYKTNYDVYDLSESDEFDRWSRQRDWRSARSPSARYVSTELTGYEDLDQNGRWFRDPTYGNVWEPRNVSSTWTPYREGRWAWVEPWGWTWMDDAPWGYATSHYGRWTCLSGNRWVWVPPQRSAGSVAYVPVYSPANVVFIRETRVVYRDRPVIAWFPLGPGEAYVPAYRASGDYLARINDSNTSWRGRDRDRYDYNQRRYVSQRDYSNVLIAGAVVAVASEIFSSSRPVQRSAVRVDNATFMSKEVARTAPVAPVKASVLAASAVTTAVAAAPPRELRERKVVAKREPPPRRVKFDRKQAELQKTAGAPIGADAEKKLGASAPASVSAVTTVQAPVAQAPAPDVSPKERNEQQRAARRAQREEEKENRAETKQQRDAERAAEKAEAEKLRAEEEAQKKAEQSQQQQQADTARQQRDAERDAAKQQADQQRAAEEAKRQAEKEEADKQRDAAKQRAEQQRAEDEAARKADREQKLDNQRRVREEADRQRAEEEAQRKAEREEADKQRAEEEAQRKAEQDQKRQAEEESRQQRDAERQQKQEEERAAREAAKKSREPQPAGEADQPDATADPEQTTTEEPVRRHKGPNPRRRGDDADQQGGVTPPVETPVEPQQQGAAELAPAPASSGPVRIEAGDAEQKLVSQPKLKYPREAEKAGVEGTVKVQTTIGIDGRVKDAIAIEGPDELKDAARENVARRRYQPTVVDGKPVEVQTEVSVDFQKQ